MMRSFTLLLLLPLSLQAQTIWPVAVGGSTISSPAPYYDPATLTIQAGDIVRWTNMSGTHNVTGTTDLFPGNPESFDSGNAANGPWSWQFTFTIPGAYHYHCTQDGHAATQTGAITVLSTTGISTVHAADGISLYPIPATSTLVVDLGNARIQRFAVIALDGKRAVSMDGNFSERVEIDVEQLAPGNYFLVLNDLDGRVSSKPFAKQ